MHCRIGARTGAPRHRSPKRASAWLVPQCAALNTTLGWMSVPLQLPSDATLGQAQVPASVPSRIAAAWSLT
jgi:hypothetical protein